jgi:phosphoribosyl 1,2-cyclic phosphate phosphodiesterase
LDLVFLGTGSAWGLPELGCPCRICQKMRSLGEERTRSAMLLSGKETLLLDCGPDIRRQLEGRGVEQLDAVLISHEHADHYLGLDDLLAFRRRLPREKWRPIPTYATKASWTTIKKTFGYLLDSLLEPRLAYPGERLAGLETSVYPFKTNHGESAPGSVGYIVEETGSGVQHKLVYTSDFFDLPKEEPRVKDPDILILQSHWLNEPVVNRPHNMSLERGIEWVKLWKPRSAVYLVHLSEAYPIDGDPANDTMKKVAARKPMRDPQTGLPYPLPTCQREWQEVAGRIFRNEGLDVPVIVPGDGLKITLW